MSELTNEEFIKFIESYNGFRIPLTEITKNFKGNSLVINDLKAYSLDDIIFSKMKYSNQDFPKSTDTFYFKEENGKLSLYLMEFKFLTIEDSRYVAEKLFYKFKSEYENNQIFNKKLFDSLMDIIQFEFEFTDIEDYEVIARQLFERFKSEYKDNQTFNENYFKYYQKIFNRYVDSVLVNIIFKVIETINIVIPELYENYCMDNNIPIKDIREYLKNTEKKFVLVFGNNSQNRNNARLQSKNPYLNAQLKKLVRGKIIDDFMIISNLDFELFLERELLL